MLRKVTDIQSVRNDARWITRHTLTPGCMPARILGDTAMQRGDQVIVFMGDLGIDSLKIKNRDSVLAHYINVRRGRSNVFRCR